MDYPSNSNKDRESEVKTAGKKQERPKDEKLAQVTSGDAVLRKQPLGKRFKETFVGGDTKGVMSYVVLDVLIPAAKDMIVDATNGGIERMLFGDNRTNRRGRNRSSNGYVSYNRYGSSGGRVPWNQDREEPRNLSRRSRAAHDFNEIIVETRGEAEEVLDKLFELISRYDQATVSDLYDLTGVKGNYTDEKWGWTDFRGAGVTRVRNGYLLDLPKPELLD